MRVKVLDASETRLPSVRQAVLRDVLYIAIASLVLVDLIYVMTNDVHAEAIAHGAAIERAITWGSFAWFSVEILTMLGNVKRRALHDFIANTVVIRTAV